MKNEVSASILFTIAVTLLTMGTSFLQEGDVTAGVACIVVGFGIILVTVYLLEKGIIERFKNVATNNS